MLSSVEIRNFRCIEHGCLQFDRRGTGIVGDNASGKTSLLEALFFLGHGRSFRTATRARLVRRGTDRFQVVARLRDEDREFVASAEHGSGATQMRLAGHGVSSVADIAEVLPLQVIDPGVHRLIDEGSARRRRILDWGVFHVKQDFLFHWRRYQRALLQRNAALREALDTSLIAAWDDELMSSADQVNSARLAYFGTFKERFEQLASALLAETVTLEYRRGWEDGLPLAQALTGVRQRDARLGTTTVGPHRADLAIRSEGVLARDRVSRGQQKLLASALILAQIHSLHDLSVPRETCLLLDDPAAELDVDKLGKLLSAIEKLPAQLIVTSVTRAGLHGIEIGRMFHVEQGCFTPML